MWRNNHGTLPPHCVRIPESGRGGYYKEENCKSNVEKLCMMKLTKLADGKRDDCDVHHVPCLLWHELGGRSLGLQRRGELPGLADSRCSGSDGNQLDYGLCGGPVHQGGNRQPALGVLSK